MCKDLFHWKPPRTQSDKYIQNENFISSNYVEVNKAKPKFRKKVKLSSGGFELRKKELANVSKTGTQIYPK